MEDLGLVIVIVSLIVSALGILGYLACAVALPVCRLLNESQDDGPLPTPQGMASQDVLDGERLAPDAATAEYAGAHHDARDQDYHEATVANGC